MFSARSFLWFLMLASAAGAYHFTDTAIKYSDKLESWKIAMPAEFPVDLSKTGKYEAALELITTSPCKVFFYVKPQMDKPVFRQLLVGLIGIIRVTDGHGNEVIKLRFEDDFLDGWPQNTDQLLPLICSHPWDVGHYQMVVEVVHPASKLNGVKQTFLVKYELCGLEYWPGIIQKGIAIFFGLACLIIGLYLYSTRKGSPVVLESVEDTADEYLR